MENKDFEITETKSREGSVFIIKGRVNTSNANTFLYTLEDALKGGKTNIILNMSQVEFLSSSGIRVILKMYKQIKETGGTFFIKEPSENVRNVLGLVALEEMLVK